MINLEQAQDAKLAVKELLDRPAWLRGIGIGRDENGSYFVKVNVNKLTDEVKSTVPCNINNVPVILAVVGDYRPY